jgi:hypothetical protein
MNYRKLYQDLCQSRQKLSRKKGQGTYFEEHHIVPECMNGSNDLENLVLLTGKEHYLAHALLCEIYPKNKKLKHAYWFMVNAEGQGQERYKVSARTYARLAEEFAKMQSNKWLKNNPMQNPESLAKNIAKRKGIVKRPDLRMQNLELVTCPHCSKVGAKNSMKRWHFENCTVKTGKKRQHKQVECFTCGHKSQPMIIKKYHNENCKLKNQNNLKLN